MWVLYQFEKSRVSFRKENFGGRTGKSGGSTDVLNNSVSHQLLKVGLVSSNTAAAGSYWLVRAAHSIFWNSASQLFNTAVIKD